MAHMCKTQEEYRPCCVWMYMYAIIYVYIYICICIYVYIYIIYTFAKYDLQLEGSRGVLPLLCIDVHV